MELKTSIEELKSLEENIKKQIKEEINSFPDNPNIKRINKNCYTMNFSEISKDKFSNFSPEYYDHKHQYKTILEVIEKTETKNIVSKIQEMIRNEFVLVGSNPCYRYKLNPFVIKKLNELVS